MSLERAIDTPRVTARAARFDARGEACEFDRITAVSLREMAFVRHRMCSEVSSEAT